MVGGTLLANNGETVRHLAIAGVGLARLGDYHVRDDLAAGRLVEVLAQAGYGDEEEINALYLGGTLVPQRIRLFLDFLLPKLQRFIAAR
jgi:DNA-binding transcriptional LysR family regulator